MIHWVRRRLGLSRTAALDPRRLRLDRALNALPAAATADLLGEILSRRGNDLGDLAGQLVDRLGQIANQLGEEAAGLSDSDAASQLRDLAGRAAGRTAQFAARSGVERLFAPPPPPRRQGSDIGLLLLAAGAGFAVGGALILLLTQRGRPAPSDADAMLPPGAEDGNAVAPGPAVMSDADRLLGGIRGRIAAAKAEADRTRRQVEQRLWQQYRREIDQ